MNKKRKIEEKLKDLNAKYKEICDEEIKVENEEIIVTLGGTILAWKN